jgi:hypothetical protein
VLEDVDSVVRGLDRAFIAIVLSFPGRPLAVVSALAEGADRLVAQRGLAIGAKLEVILPLPVDEYQRDFDTGSSRQAFATLLAQAASVTELPIAEPRDAAYEAAGLAVLERSDVVIAVWDGRKAQGRGGTGAIVAEARRRGLPVAWVHAGNRRLGSNQPTTLGNEQGRVTFERFAGVESDEWRVESS